MFYSIYMMAKPETFQQNVFRDLQVTMNSSQQPHEMWKTPLQLL